VARIRSVKPEFWTDGTMVGLSIAARLFYIGTWNFSLCDRGHLPDDPVGLRLKILPADDVDALALIEELLASGRLVRRHSAGRSYLYNPRLGDHQKTESRWQSRCPHCASEEAGGFVEESPSLPEPRASSAEHAEPPPTSAQDSKGGEGIGRVEVGRVEVVPPTAGAKTRREPRKPGNELELPQTAQTYLAEWLDHCASRPPGSVVGQVGKQLKAMLAEGIDPADVRAGLAAWHVKGLHPSTLPSVVNELMNASPAQARASPNGSTADRRVASNATVVDFFEAKEITP